MNIEIISFLKSWNIPMLFSLLHYYVMLDRPKKKKIYQKLYAKL